jgi:hypothetical protein
MAAWEPIRLLGTSYNRAITWLRFGEVSHPISRTSAGFIVTVRGKLGLAEATGTPALDGLTTVTFADAGGKTRMTADTHATALTSGAVQYFQVMNDDWTQTPDRLDVEAAAFACNLSRT